MSPNKESMIGPWRVCGGTFFLLAIISLIPAILESISTFSSSLGLSAVLGGSLYAINLHWIVALGCTLLVRLIRWRATPRQLAIIALGAFLCFELSLVGGYWLSNALPLPSLYTIQGKAAILGIGLGGLIIAAAVTFVIARRGFRQGWTAMATGKFGAVGITIAVILILTNGILLSRAYLCRNEINQRAGSDQLQRQDLIVILVDTLRRDHLSYFGYPRPTSPNIDNLFNESWVFTNAYTPSSWTMPSIASLFTGLYPTAHGVVKGFNVVPDQATTLAEHLRSYGYRTGAFVSNHLVNARNGFAQGFEHFLPPPPPRWNHHGRTAIERIVQQIIVPGDLFRGWKLNSELLAWLRIAPEQPHFIYIHYLEPHTPYEPPAKHRDAVAAGVGPGPKEPPLIESYRDVLEEIDCNDWECLEDPPQLSAESLTGMIANYDGDIHLADQRVGDLIEELKKMGIYDRSHILFCSDHGEQFFEHDGWFHGNSIYEEMTGCALAYRPPGGFTEGKILSRNISLLDVIPSICRRMGLEEPPFHQGVTIPELVENQMNRRERPILSELPPYLFSLRWHQWKLIRRGPADSPIWRLFNLDDDPMEQTDLAGVEPDTLAYLQGYLEGMVAEFSKGSLGTAEPNHDPEMLRKLRNLGYIK